MGEPGTEALQRPIGARIEAPIRTGVGRGMPIPAAGGVWEGSSAPPEIFVDFCVS